MRLLRAVPALPLAALLLTGCGADPAADRREQVAALTEAANAGDADSVRARADTLMETVAGQVERQELAADTAERVIALAQAVRAGADVIDDELLEQRRVEAETEAERQRLEAERQQLEEDQAKAEQERQKAEERGKGKAKDKDD